MKSQDTALQGAQPVFGADPWAALRRHTPARIALGVSGDSLPTAHVLDLGIAHAQARDAVHQPLDVDAIQKALQPLGLPTVHVCSAAPDRAHYLLRPDWGRQLSTASLATLQHLPVAPCDVLVVVGDGLSANAVQRYAQPLLQALVPALQKREIHLGPLVVAQQARVALGDPIGQCLDAKLVLMLIGERPGLSCSDSMGAYLTWNPRVGTADAARNCVSNIRDAGLVPHAAAIKLQWLIEQALALSVTGIALKDGSAQQALPAETGNDTLHLNTHRAE